jgi:hypothetical protein
MNVFKKSKKKTRAKIQGFGKRKKRPRETLPGKAQ